MEGAGEVAKGERRKEGGGGEGSWRGDVGKRRGKTIHRVVEYIGEAEVWEREVVYSVVEIQTKVVLVSEGGRETKSEMGESVGETTGRLNILPSWGRWEWMQERLLHAKCEVSEEGWKQERRVLTGIA